MIRAWRSWRLIQEGAKAKRCFTASAVQREIRDLNHLPPRIHPKYQETSRTDLLALQWPAPPRNILLIRKEQDPDVDSAFIEFANHIQSTYPEVSLVLEPYLAKELHHQFSFPIYTPRDASSAQYAQKVDLTSTLGGDGTILHAASLFATSRSVPPILSFSMGTLGFLGEWKFSEYKRAFREVYVSGAPSPLPARSIDEPAATSTPATSFSSSSSPSASNSTSSWSTIRGKSMGASRNSRILLRNRLRVGLFAPDGNRLPHTRPHPAADTDGDSDQDNVYALNEVLLHRGTHPHLAHITILIGAAPHQRTLTTAIADGFLVSTPTGSTAYSLSAGGSIVHPLVSSMLLTPICPRSLSFRPLVLPANTPITLRIDEENRGKEIEVSIDGVRRKEGLRAGMEVRVTGEEVRSPGAPGARDWLRGVPSIVRSGGSADEEDHWVGGLNSLLKFNYPFGEDG